MALYPLCFTKRSGLKHSEEHRSQETEIGFWSRWYVPTITTAAIKEYHFHTETLYVIESVICHILAWTVLL